MPPPTRTYEYYRRLFSSVRMPFAFIDLDYFDENARQIARRAAGRRVRIASKSVRCVGMLERIFAASPQFQGLMAYNADEAVFLSQKGFDDILVAYPFWGEAQVEALSGELRKGKQIVAMLDCEAHARRLSELGQRSGVSFPVCMDVDLSSDFPGIHFGVYRSGLTQAAQVKRLADLIKDLPMIELVGMMGYEAQIAGLQDYTPGSLLMNTIIPLLKRRSLGEVRRRREALVKAAGGAQLRFVNGGGTGSLETTAQEPWLSELTAGSGFFAPTVFDGYRAFKHLPAAAFALEITRRPRPDLYTCLGGGYVASGSAGKGKLPSPYLPEGARLLENEGAGEVQTPVRYSGSQALALGDPIFFRHAKAGELCERFNQLYLVSEGQITGIAPTYRGEGQCFM